MTRACTKRSYIIQRDALAETTCYFTLPLAFSMHYTVISVRYISIFSTNWPCLNLPDVCPSTEGDCCSLHTLPFRCVPYCADTNSPSWHTQAKFLYVADSTHIFQHWNGNAPWSIVSGAMASSLSLTYCLWISQTRSWNSEVLTESHSFTVLGWIHDGIVNRLVPSHFHLLKSQAFQDRSHSFISCKWNLVSTRLYFLWFHSTGQKSLTTLQSWNLHRFLTQTTPTV